MFDGLNNNRAHWNEQAEVYNAKMKAIEDQKKKLEDDEARKCKIKSIKSMFIGSILYSQSTCIDPFCDSVCLPSWRREIKDLHHLLSSSDASGSGLMRSN